MSQKIIKIAYGIISIGMIVVIIALYNFQVKQSSKEQTGNLKYVSTYEIEKDNSKISYNGKLYKAGKINVVVLNGSYKEMGMQYGALLKTELNNNYNGILNGLKNINTTNFEYIQEEGNAIYSTYPKKYKEIVDGLAETSELGLEKAKFLLAQETYVFNGLLELVSDENVSGSANCSGLAVWDDFTVSGQMLFGRNYDLGPVNHEYVTLVVYNPIDGSIPSASFTFAGAIYTTTGINKAGLFLELNNGSTSDKGNFMGERIMAPLTLFSFLEQASNTDELSILFNTTLPDLSYIINSADKDNAYSYEWSTQKVIKRASDEGGLMAATNIFFDPAWGEQDYNVKNDPDAIIKRRDNLLALAKENKGKIDANKMMEIISTPLEDGGSFRAPNLTSYEIVAEPENLKLWLMIPEYQDWVEINLTNLFN